MQILIDILKNTFVMKNIRIEDALDNKAKQTKTPKNQ